jgi:hypothetical protein
VPRLRRSLTPHTVHTKYSAMVPDEPDGRANVARDWMLGWAALRAEEQNDRVAEQRRAWKSMQETANTSQARAARRARRQALRAAVIEDVALPAFLSAAGDVTATCDPLTWEMRTPQGRPVGSCTTVAEQRPTSPEPSPRVGPLGTHNNRVARCLLPEFEDAIRKRSRSPS